MSITSAPTVRVGQPPLVYEAVPGWPRTPAGCNFVEIAGVATDSERRVFVFNRGTHPVAVFSAEGEFLFSWGDEMFARPHGIHIDERDVVYCIDDLGHVVHQFTTAGEWITTWGVFMQGSETGVVNRDYRTIKQAAGPFNQPCNLAISPHGEFFVCDGYGNARVHRYSRHGQWEFAWGAPGDKPGQFNLPHGIAVDSQGRVFVADRENSRLQIFDRQGKVLEVWKDIARPCEVFIDAQDRVFVAEVGYRAGMYAGNVAPPNPVGGRVSIFDSAGKLLSRFGGGDNPCAPGDFFAPHDIWVDRRGDVYVGEVTMSAGGNRGLVSPDCHCLQKFALIAG